MDWQQAAGPCLARALAQNLWAGEGFFLQVRPLQNLLCSPACTRLTWRVCILVSIRKW